VCCGSLPANKHEPYEVSLLRSAAGIPGKPFTWKRPAGETAIQEHPLEMARRTTSRNGNALRQNEPDFSIGPTDGSFFGKLSPRL
jgi:hypothetical protein